MEEERLEVGVVEAHEVEGGEKGEHEERFYVTLKLSTINLTKSVTFKFNNNDYFVTFM